MNPRTGNVGQADWAELDRESIRLAGKTHLSHRVDVLVDAGVLVLDNYRIVRGRRLFCPRFDGADRWLRCCTRTRDLRTSRELGSSAESWVIKPHMPIEAS